MNTVAPKEIIADLPSEIVKPVVEDIMKKYRFTGIRNNAKYPGLKSMSRACHVQERTITDILDGTKKKVSLEIADKLTVNSQYDLDTLYEDAIEWAKKNPNKRWPEKY